jgi:hypothetical protein
MTAIQALEPSTDENLREYGQRRRFSVAARASVLDSERRRFEQDLQQLRARAGGRTRD